MKIRYLLAAIILLSPISALAATYDTSTFASYSDSPGNCQTNTNHSVVVYVDSTSAPVGYRTCGSGFTFADINSAFSVAGTVYRFVEISVFDANINRCLSPALSPSSCNATYGSGVTIGVWTYDPPPPPPPAFDSELAAATSTFSATTGFDIGGVITWAGDNLIKLFIGSLLAIIYSVRGWLVAMVVIGAIVYFAYRAFRFFRH